MNILFFHTKRMCWMWDFLILMIELVISCLPKRVRLFLEPANQPFVMNQEYNIVENQSGDLK